MFDVRGRPLNLITHTEKGFHYKDKMVSQSSYFYNGNAHTWRDLSIGIGPRLVLSYMHASYHMNICTNGLLKELQNAHSKSVWYRLVEAVLHNLILYLHLCLKIWIHADNHMPAVRSELSVWIFRQHDIIFFSNKRFFYILCFRQNDYNFVDIFIFISLNENCCIAIQIPLECVHIVSTDY